MKKLYILKSILIGLFAIFLFIFLFSLSAQAGFWDLFRAKKAFWPGAVVSPLEDSSGAVRTGEFSQPESGATLDLIDGFLTILPESADIKVGENKNFQAFYQPLKSQSKNLVMATWTTSDPTVATISYKKSLFFSNYKIAIVSGVSAGTTKIKATYKNISFTIPVTVIKKEIYEKLKVIGDESKLGSYDPSVEYDDKGVGYLAYSGASSFEFRDIDTHLAKSVNGGKTWTYAAHISQARRTTIAYRDNPDKKINVVQRHETPSLLFDPSDPDKNGRWKLFLVSGFSVGEKGLTKNTIWPKIFVTFRKAKTPEMLAGAQETILFASEELPVGYFAKYNVDDFSPSLKKTIAYMEPGTLVKNGIIYLSLNAKGLAGEKTILLSSKDYGESWGYVGTLIDDNEVVNPEYPMLTSSSMAEENGRYFLFVSPKLAADKGGYNGVYIFEFENVDAAELNRDGKGELIVHKYVPTITTVGLGGGQSEYHSGNYYGGIMMSQSWMTGPINERFMVGSTKEKIIDKK